MSKISALAAARPAVQTLEVLNHLLACCRSDLEAQRVSVIERRCEVNDGSIRHRTPVLVVSVGPGNPRIEE